MLRFFRKKKKGIDVLQNWHIPVEATYELIDNGDSVQFVNADASCILYFSLLIVKDNPLLPPEILTKIKPSINHSQNGWEFKGAKQGGNEILVCLFTFINEADKTQLTNLFTSIVYNVK